MSKHFSGLLCDCLNRNPNCDDHIFVRMSAVHIIFIYEIKTGKINYYNAFFKESCTIIKIDRLINIGNESKSTKITRLETEDTITTDPIEIINIDPLSQNLSGEDSTWMVDRLEIPRIIDCFFITWWNCFGKPAWKSNCRFIYLSQSSFLNGKINPRTLASS